jgi:hypothetical protein
VLIPVGNLRNPSITLVFNYRSYSSHNSLRFENFWLVLAVKSNLMSETEISFLGVLADSSMASCTAFLQIVVTYPSIPFYVIKPSIHSLDEITLYGGSGYPPNFEQESLTLLCRIASSLEVVGSSSLSPIIIPLVRNHSGLPFWVSHVDFVFSVSHILAQLRKKLTAWIMG